MKQIGMLCLMLTLAVSVVSAQKSVIKVEAMSPHRLEEMKVANPLAPANRSSGLTVVGVGSKVWLSGWDATGDTAFKAGASYLWSLTSKPSGSTATLDSTDKQWTGLRPDKAGNYVVKLTIGGKDTSVTITAATYTGADRHNLFGAVVNCATCHVFAKAEAFNGWKTSGHAKMFEKGMNGVNGAYWGKSCFECHTTSYDTLAVNGGFDDVASAVGFVDTQWKPWRSGLYDSLLTTDKKTVSLLAGITCESCHGPKNPMHFGSGTQPKTMDAGVCAQCHNEPWRHNRYVQWEFSKHSEAVWSSSFQSSGTAVLTNYNLSACVRCHDGKAFVSFTEGASFDNRRSSGYSPITHTKLTCQTCHDPHTTQLRTAPTSADTLGNGYTYTNDNFGEGKLCVNCHKYRREVNSYVKTNMSSHWGPHYAGAGDVLLGQNGYTFGDNLLPDMTKSGHMRVENTCVGCHMAATPDTGQVARDKIGMHTWNISYKAPDGKEYENLTMCKSCHVDAEKEKKAFVDKIDGMMKKIAMNLPPVGSEEIDRNSIATHKDSVKLKQVFWNYLYVEEEKSHGIHNPRYTTYLLQKSLQALGLPTEVEPLAGVVPATFELAQNYPNPFNPTTEIRFSLPKESNVKIVVFDIMGRLVTTLVNQRLGAGGHRVVWNGSDQNGQAVSSGVYFYYMQAEGFTATKRMALIK